METQTSWKTASSEGVAPQGAALEDRSVWLRTAALTCANACLWSLHLVPTRGGARGSGVSGLWPKDRLTWWLEVAPALLGLAMLVFSRRSFRFTPLLQNLIALHMILLAVGGHYTYAEVPLGHWVAEVFNLGRNHYDRLGHFAQGLVPALIAREIIIRRGIVRSRAWIFFFAICSAMTISAVYELIEWISAMIYGQNAMRFSAGKVTYGTRRKTWPARWSAQCLESWCSVAGTTGSC